MEHQQSRRQFVWKNIQHILTITGMVTFMHSCSETVKEKKDIVDPKTVAEPCKDYSGLAESDLKARQNMGYTPVSPIADRRCNNCNLFLPPPAGKPCGKCQLFKGPVEAGGHCTYWAPQVKKSA